MDRKNINGRLSTLKKFKRELNELINNEKKSLVNFEKSLKDNGIIAKKLDSLVKANNNSEEKKIIAKEIIKSSKEVDPGCVEIEVKGISVVERDKYLAKRNKVSDVNFIKKLEEKINNIPVSNGSRYFDKLDINIGIVADEFLFNSLKDAANFIYITPDNYEEYKTKLDLFFVATAWSGLNKEWVGLSNRNSKARETIVNIINEYKKCGIKVAFYSKEDPVHYGAYVDLAAECDYIFTTEKAVVENYVVDCNNKNVSVLSFGINPVYHNPIGIKKFEKEKEVFFSGSWYNKYPERNKDAIKIFDGVLDASKSLRLVDRNYELNNFKYFFPEKYLKYVVPSVKHDKLQKLHKLYDWSINLNTIKYSPSMFANRIYELQALGNIILSNYSIGVNNLFPNVFLVNNKEEVKDILNSFTKEEIYKHQILGVRRVMSKETAYDRVQFICEKTNIKCLKMKKRVAVVVNNFTDKIKKMFESQSYIEKELILKSQLTDEVKSKFDIIAFFDENSNYGRYYLEDMINAFKYTNSDYITKDSYYEGEKLITGLEHDYVKCIKDKNRTIFWANSFSTNELLNIKKNTDRKNGYSIDHFEYNEVDLSTVKIDKNNYKLSVIIAAYNNGDHLLNKCFNSLKRSSLFNYMEIIIVDDGSTDDYTPRIIEYIQNNNDNVKTYFFNDGGSGSASRPRNKGFELSTAKYITYLDPDNEAINDGYFKLYNELKKGNYDLVTGNMLKLAEKESDFDLYNNILEYNNGCDVLEGDKKQYIYKSNFYSMSIQALIFKREVIEKNNLKMIEGVFGEDTVFYFELLLAANKVKVINTDIHIYYAAVEGSSVNNITKKFFEKYVDLEKVRINKYKELSLLDKYMEKKFNLFVVNWYFKKLKLVFKEDIIDSIKAIYNILDMYKPYVEKDFKISTIRNFYELAKQKKYETIIEQYIDD